MGSFDQHESTEQEKQLTTQALLERLQKEGSVYRFIDENDLKTLSLEEKNALSGKSTPLHPELKQETQLKLKHLAEKRLEKIYEKIEAHPVSKYASFRFNGPSIAFYPHSGVHLFLMECHLDGSATPSYQSLAIDTLEHALDDMKLMISALELALQGESDTPEEAFNLNGNTLEWNKKDQFFDEELGEIHGHPDVFLFTINSRYRESHKQLKTAREENKIEAQARESTRQKNRAEMLKKFPEVNEWEQNALKRKAEADAYKEQLASEFQSGEQPGLKTSFFKMEFFSQGLPEELKTEAETNYQELLKKLNTQKPTEPNPDFLKTLQSSISPENSYSKHQASSIYALAKIGEAKTQNCHARALMTSMLLEDLYPEHRDKIHIQIMSGHIRVLFEIKGEHYILEPGIQKLSEDNWSLSSNYLLGNADSLLKGYAGLEANWSYVQNGIPGQNEASDDVTNQATFYGTPSLPLSKFQYVEPRENRMKEDAEANTTTKKNPLENPVFELVAKGDLPAVEQWLASGGNPHLLSPDGTPLVFMEANNEIQEAIVELFMKHGMTLQSYLNISKEYTYRSAIKIIKPLTIAAIEQGQINKLNSFQFEDVFSAIWDHRKTDDEPLLMQLIQARNITDLDIMVIRKSTHNETKVEFINKHIIKNRKVHDWEAIDYLAKSPLYNTKKDRVLIELLSSGALKKYDAHYPEKPTFLGQRLNTESNRWASEFTHYESLGYRLDDKDEQGRFKHYPNNFLQCEPLVIKEIQEMGIDLHEKDSLGRSWNDIILTGEDYADEDWKKHIRKSSVGAFRDYIRTNPNSDINATDENGRSALHLNPSLLRGEAELSLLKEAGMDFNIIDKQGHSFIDSELARYGAYNLEHLMVALNLGYNPTNPKRRGAFKRTHLMNLFWKKTVNTRYREECIDMLIERGEDINAQDIFGRTALMYATRLGDETLIKYLLSKGADPNIEDKWGGDAESYVLSMEESKINRHVLAELRKAKQ